MLRCFFRVFSCLLLLLPLQPLLCTVARCIFWGGGKQNSVHVTSCLKPLNGFTYIPGSCLLSSPEPALAPAPTFSSLSLALWPPTRSGPSLHYALSCPRTFAQATLLPEICFSHAPHLDHTCSSHRSQQKLHFLRGVPSCLLWVLSGFSLVVMSLILHQLSLYS